MTPDGIITSIPTDSGDIVKWTISPSRKRVATLREVQNDTSGGGKKKVVEIWEEDRPLISFDASKSHGAFYGDGSLQRRMIVSIVSNSFHRDSFGSIILTVRECYYLCRRNKPRI